MWCTEHWTQDIIVARDTADTSEEETAVGEKDVNTSQQYSNKHSAQLYTEKQEKMEEFTLWWHWYSFNEGVIDTEDDVLMK